MELLEMTVYDSNIFTFKLKDTWEVKPSQVNYYPNRSAESLICTCSLGKRPCGHIDYLHRWLITYSTSYVQGVLQANAFQSQKDLITTEVVQELRAATLEQTTRAFERRSEEREAERIRVMQTEISQQYRKVGRAIMDEWKDRYVQSLKTDISVSGWKSVVPVDPATEGGDKTVIKTVKLPPGKPKDPLSPFSLIELD